MTQSELIDILATKMPESSKMEIERIVRTFFDTIIKALEQGRRVELRGFGSFQVKHRPARVGCDPRTGHSISVEERYIPFFKSGKAIHDALNQK
jgi:integration host factor subunit beta